MPRAIHIDPWKETVEEVEVPNENILPKLHEMVGGYIELAAQFPNGDVLYVDEEGLLKDYDAFFDIGAHQPFAGKGLIVGKEIDEEGHLADAATDAITVTMWSHLTAPRLTLRWTRKS